MTKKKKTKQETTVKVEKAQKGNPFEAELASVNTTDYLIVDARRSKYYAAVLNGLKHTISKGDVILYLGASAGYTASFLAHTAKLIYTIELSPVMTRELVFTAEKLNNIAPLLADANKVETYTERIKSVNFIFQDISQKNQVKIFIKNIKAFLPKGEKALITLKTRSINSIAKPQEVLKEAEKELRQEKNIKILQTINLTPYEKDHYLLAIEKQ